MVHILEPKITTSGIFHAIQAGLRLPATVNSEEDSSDCEQRVADGASLQPYQFEPEDGDNPMTDSDPPDDDPEDDPRLGNSNWQVE